MAIEQKFIILINAYGLQKLRIVEVGLSSGFICHVKINCCILKLIIFINSFVRHINVPLCSNDNDDNLSRH